MGEFEVDERDMENAATVKTENLAGFGGRS